MARRTVLDKNFRFLTLEVIKQIERTQKFLSNPRSHIERQIRQRDDYIDHLKSVIENKSFEYLSLHGQVEKETADLLRSLNVVTSNLERIADHAVNIVGQTDHFTDPSFFQRYNFGVFFEHIVSALKLVRPALTDRDLSKALLICEAEAELDELYRHKFERILAEMASSDEVPNLVTALFIFHYLERIGDGLLNIGEAIIFAKMGEKLKYRQYQALQDALRAIRPTHEEEPLNEVEFEGIWGTRSGCRIGKISEREPVNGRDRGLIYKEGSPDKIRLESENIDRWNQLVPGLPPRVVEFQKNERDAAIVIEYLEGRTVQDIVISQDLALLDEALGVLTTTLRSIWTETRRDVEVRAHYFQQLADRLDDVLRVHPYFGGSRQQIGGVYIPAYPEMVRQVQALDEHLVAPFRVFGHGDFNIDNIIFDAGSSALHFIDLHRSKEMDYLADVSVFIVSNFRLPVFDLSIRALLNHVIEHMYEFVRDFAAEQGDDTWSARLAAGLIRSFTTSTRFEPDRQFAQTMQQRAAYLLERLNAHPADSLETFAVPEDVLLY